jgi:hypothetical protein
VREPPLLLHAACCYMYCMLPLHCMPAGGLFIDSACCQCLILLALRVRPSVQGCTWRTLGTVV